MWAKSTSQVPTTTIFLLVNPQGKLQGMHSKLQRIKDQKLCTPIKPLLFPHMPLPALQFIVQGMSVRMKPDLLMGTLFRDGLFCKDAEFLKTLRTHLHCHATIKQPMLSEDLTTSQHPVHLMEKKSTPILSKHMFNFYMFNITVLEGSSG